MFQQLAPPVFYAIILTAIVYRWRFFHLPGVKLNWVLTAWLIKIFAGVGFFLVYTLYYTDPAESDALRYFKDALTIKEQWHLNRDVFWSFMLGQNMDHPEYVKIYDQLVAWTSEYRYGLSNDCSTIIRFNVILSFISFENFHVHTLLMSFMSFVGFTAMYRGFRSLMEGKEKWLFLACFLLPSVLFWSSSVLKEAPLFMALGLLLLSLHNIRLNHRAIFYGLIFVLSFVLLIYTKVYVIISLIPALISLLVIRISGSKMILMKFLITHVCCFMIAQQAHHFFRGGDFLYVLHKKQVDFLNVAQLTNARSAIYIPPVTNTPNFFAHYPRAFFLTYFRPHIFETRSMVYFLFAIENAFYLLLCLTVIVFFRRPKKADLPFLFMIISYLLILASILGNCVPILGAIVRYKVVGLPLFVILCFYFLDEEKIKRTFSALKQKFWSQKVIG